MTKQTEAQERLAHAQQALKDATTAEAQVREHHQKITDAARRGEDLQQKLDELQANHSQTLLQWAKDGAKGDAPVPSADLRQLEAELLDAKTSANAARMAAAAHQAEVDTASRNTASAMQLLRDARQQVLADIAAPMIAEYREARLREHALMEHILGLQAIARELTDEVPGIGDLTNRIAQAMKIQPVLENGGAEKSRQAWRELVKALFDDSKAALGPAPEAVDADAHLPRRMVA